MKTKTLINLILVTSTLTGCATKGSKKVYAHPYFIPKIRSAINTRIQDAPRTQPGKVMDPSSITYAQVPNRIIYIPGDQGVYGRTSARQEISYDLIPVSRTKEIQGERTPYFEEKDKNQPTVNPNVFPSAFLNPNGSTSKGLVRRLFIKEVVEKERAESLLKPTEQLRWSAEDGWVGFTETELIKPKIKEKETSLPETLSETPHGKPPEVLEREEHEEMKPISGNSMKKENFNLDTNTKLKENNGTEETPEK